MAKVKFEGREFRLVTHTTARARDVMALQNESGMKLSEISELGQRSESFALVVTIYLSLHNAGIFITWDDLIDKPLTEIGEVIPEPGDLERYADVREADAEPNPQKASATVVADADADATPDATDLRPRSRG